ncbi:hypothetical protein [Iningainema tapete]|uniref:Uncharacterized protein n=1 Tax=Iningainema tapete BLCC-T55 TaxID=2748662 RepID=A0A8J7CFB4_9CYAN|nr:hypothetical protein [Iningainema tapete]MBD2774615.1 hypothetical protein [Iningainema tapete BLCC-T55]
MKVSHLPINTLPLIAKFRIINDLPTFIAPKIHNCGIIMEAIATQGVGTWKKYGRRSV